MSDTSDMGGPDGNHGKDLQRDVKDDLQTGESQAGGEGSAAPGGGDTAAGTVRSESPEQQVTELRDTIGRLEEENSDLKDQYLRKQADFENFRKRMFREKEESAKYANSQLMLDLISIIDDFERAIKSADESKDFDAFHDGVVLIERQFTGMLERKWGLRRFDSEGEVFDPQRHEAISMESSAKHDKSVVLEDFQKGYFLHDRVLRPARVKVAMPVLENETEDQNRNQ